MTKYRDTYITYILSKYKLNVGVILYQIISSNPIDIGLTIIASKFGIPPFIIVLIMTFL